MTQPLLAQQNYQQLQVLTASRGQLLLIAYNSILGAMLRARRALGRGDRTRAGRYLLTAQQGIVILLGTLNHEASPRLASELRELYLYVFKRVAESMLNGSPGPLDEAHSIIESLHAAWKEALSA